MKGWGVLPRASKILIFNDYTSIADFFFVASRLNSFEFREVSASRLPLINSFPFPPPETGTKSLPSKSCKKSPAPSRKNRELVFSLSQAEWSQMGWSGPRPLRSPSRPPTGMHGTLTSPSCRVVWGLYVREYAVRMFPQYLHFPHCFPIDFFIFPRAFLPDFLLFWSHSTLNLLHICFSFWD